MSVIVRSQAEIATKYCNNFKSFAVTILSNINNYASVSKRIDIVADLYYNLSIKGATRINRGSGARFPFDGDSSLPTDFNFFLKNTENKSDLNLLLATESK